MVDSFFTIAEPGSSAINISKSKFISQAFPAESFRHAQQIIKSVKEKYFDASHHPFACRFGPGKNNFKSSDDGEPSGSSGKPVLEAIDKYNLTDIVVIVTRYFGGVKLGTGGLRRAYFEAANVCLSEAQITEKFITEKVNLEFEYRFMNVIMNLIESEHITLVKNYSDEKCKLTLEVRISKLERIRNLFNDLTNGTVILS